MLWGFLLAFLSLMPTGPSSLAFLGLPYIDKVGHFGMYAIWAFLVVFAMEGTSRLSKTNRLWLVFLLASMTGAAFEYGQYAMTAGRSFEIWDMVANGLGALTGSLADNFWLGRGVKQNEANRFPSLPH